MGLHWESQAAKRRRLECKVREEALERSKYMSNGCDSTKRDPLNGVKRSHGFTSKGRPWVDLTLAGMAMKVTADNIEVECSSDYTGMPEAATCHAMMVEAKAVRRTLQDLGPAVRPFPDDAREREVMTVDRFVKEYMPGEPSPIQRAYIRSFLAGEREFIGAGRGAGRTTVRRAVAKYLANCEPSIRLNHARSMSPCLVCGRPTTSSIKCDICLYG